MASSPSADLGHRLRRAGLREPLAIAAFGGATGIHAARLAGGARPLGDGPAAAILELLVAGRPIAAGRAADLFADLVEIGLVERRGDELAARARVVPYRGLLLVCSPGALPDDSSLHLIGALPDSCAGRWLDVGSGCGIALLSRPRLATERLGTDIDGAAIEWARLGAGLSGLEPPPAFAVADLFEGIAGPFDLVSFNAPLPLTGGLLERFWEGAARCLAPGAEVVVHATGDALPPLGGEVIGLRYTPAAAPAPFAVIRWRPDRPARRRLEAVELTASAPHISRPMFDR